jgi:hypothetical protein
MKEYIAKIKFEFYSRIVDSRLIKTSLSGGDGI